MHTGTSVSITWHGTVYLVPVDRQRRAALLTDRAWRPGRKRHLWQVGRAPHLSISAISSQASLQHR